ncbi:hypothetical protein BV898_05846 [Hypsibius exemplaris]|uniref:Uncharacterized protein n=1 Tax=Hypsibius exemplaris TaxID=2072580 RepID=A0A1W0WYQ9_HYPEX|nr:hypothetical protein BV898_05846 [Hypsibius exemplaris]
MDVQMPSVIASSSGSNGHASTLLSPQRVREAKYEVLLFFVELLMEHKSRKLHDLSCLFGSPNFSAEMKQVVGGSQMGLKRFLLKHPSLFTIKGDTVTMTCYDLEDVFRNGFSAPNGVATSIKGQDEVPRPTTTPEEEAVEYFRSKLLASPVKDDIRQAMPLRSLIGHRSQAPEKIRFIMGRNLPDFIRFVRSHSDVFVYDPVSDTVKLAPSAQRSPRDCPSPTNSSASSRSMSIPSGEFDANDCMDFLGGVLQQKGPLFLDELYGHLNKKYKPDVRQHFAKNPRELGEMIQQKGGTRFTVEGNLVTFHGVPSPTEPSGPYKSPPGSAREGMKLRLAQTLKQVVSDNKAKGTLPEPELDKTWIPPWTEISKPKQLKGLVSEILDSSAGADAVGLAFICDFITDTTENGETQPNSEVADNNSTNSLLNYKLTKILLATYDGKVHLISIAEHPELLRLGGLKELLASDKIRKVFHDGSRGLAALINQYGLRIVNPFDTQVGYSILDYQSNPNCTDLFLETNRSLSVLEAANGCAPAAARTPNTPGNLGALEVQLYEAYVDLKIAFPHVYEVLKSRISVRYGTMMRVMLEEQYEDYLNPGRATLLRKNRRTLQQLDQLQAKLNNYSANPNETMLSDEERRLQDMVGHSTRSYPSNNDTAHNLIHDIILPDKKETCDAECQTMISGEIRPLTED